MLQVREEEVNKGGKRTWGGETRTLVGFLTEKTSGLAKRERMGARKKGFAAT